MSTPALPVPQGVSIHGPYEDAIVAGLKLLEKVIDSQPPEAKKKAWDDFFAFFDRAMQLADKLDVFRLFSGPK